MYQPKRNKVNKRKEPPTEFTQSELLHMEIKAMLLFGKDNMHWWQQLSLQEKHRLLYTEQYEADPGEQGEQQRKKNRKKDSK